MEMTTLVQIISRAEVTRIKGERSASSTELNPVGNLLKFWTYIAV